jgi:hypothetical protein
MSSTPPWLDAEFNGPLPPWAGQVIRGPLQSRRKQGREGRRQGEGSRGRPREVRAPHVVTDDMPPLAFADPRPTSRPQPLSLSAILEELEQIADCLADAPADPAVREALDLLQSLGERLRR